MSAQQSSVICTSCQTPNAHGARFCAQCGGGLSAMPHAAAPTPRGGSSLQIAHDALARVNAQVTGDNGSETASYQLAYRDRWLAWWPMQFTGSLSVRTDAPAGQAASASATMTPQSLAIQVGALIAASVALGFVPNTIVSNEQFFGSVAVGLGVTAWVVFLEGPKRVKRLLEGAVADAMSASPASQIGGAAPPVPPAVPLTPSPVPSGGDVFARLNKAAEMHAAGLLSAEEFAAKKAELLARI